MDELTTCLDLAYHELRYVYQGQSVFVPEVIRSNMNGDLKRKYYRDPEFRKRLNSVLRYAVQNGGKIIRFAENKIKRNQLPHMNGKPLDIDDITLLLELNAAANLGPSLAAD